MNQVATGLKLQRWGASGARARLETDHLERGGKKKGPGLGNADH